MALATAYDAVNAAIFLPSGGSRRLRQALVDALDVRPGDRVLELGCGTAQVTARLPAAGADVVAVEELPAMLAAARRRAPGATLVEGDAITAEVGGGYQRVVLSFVLHDFDADGRLRLPRRARRPLRAGRVGVLDWHLPRGRLRRAMWRRFLGAPEPAPGATREVLDGALGAEIPAAGLTVAERRRAAGGRTPDPRRPAVRLMAAPPLPLAGGCVCGGVRFEVSAPLLGAVYCHCKRRQRRTGSAYSVTALTAPGSFRVVEGEGLVRSWAPVDGWVKSFCAECGGQVHTTHPQDPRRISVRMGALDDDPGITPSAHQFTDDAAPWDPIPDGRPRFPERLPEGGPPETSAG